MKGLVLLLVPLLPWATAVASEEQVWGTYGRVCTYRLCERCGGGGRLGTFRRLPAFGCPRPALVPAGDEECWACSGRGVIRSGPCEDCDGTGLLKTAPGLYQDVPCPSCWRGTVDKCADFFRPEWRPLLLRGELKARDRDAQPGLFYRGAP